MKKIIAILLSLTLAAGMSACQNQTASPPENSSSQASQAPEVSQPQSSSQQQTSQSESSPQPQNSEPQADPGQPERGEPAGAQGGRTLIAYFSLGNNAGYPDGVDATTSASLVLDGGNLYGTTEYMANLIQQAVGGDLHRIQTTEPYSTDFDTVVDQNHQEANNGTLPELAASDLDVSQYDTVFIGYPIWATDAPQAIFSFLSQYDLSGKTVVPFCTHDGYGAGSSYGSIAGAVPGAAAVLDGLAVEAPDVPGAADTVAQWLQGIGIGQQAEETAQTGETPITITVGDTVLDSVLYDTALAHEIAGYFPLTISTVGYGGREFYGGVDFYPENLSGSQRTFENGHITYCEDHHNMAIFYAQTDDSVLSVDVIPIGKVTSDLSIFDELPGSVNITFALAE